MGDINPGLVDWGVLKSVVAPTHCLKASGKDLNWRPCNPNDATFLFKKIGSKIYNKGNYPDRPLGVNPAETVFGNWLFGWPPQGATNTDVEIINDGMFKASGGCVHTIDGWPKEGWWNMIIHGDCGDQDRLKFVGIKDISKYNSSDASHSPAFERYCKTDELWKTPICEQAYNNTNYTWVKQHVEDKCKFGNNIFNEPICKKMSNSTTDRDKTIYKTIMKDKCAEGANYKNEQCKDFCNNPANKIDCDKFMLSKCEETNYADPVCSCLKPLSKVPGFENSPQSNDAYTPCVSRVCQFGNHYKSNNQLTMPCNVCLITTNITANNAEIGNISQKCEQSSTNTSTTPAPASNAGGMTQEQVNQALETQRKQFEALLLKNTQEEKAKRDQDEIEKIELAKSQLIGKEASDKKKKYTIIAIIIILLLLILSSSSLSGVLLAE